MRPMPSPETQRVFAPGIFDGTVVLVTGGGTGIGFGTALEMARLGASVVLCGRTPKKLEKAAEQISAEISSPDERVL